MPRKPSCLCGECPKCKMRIRGKERWDAMTPEERKAVVAKRDRSKTRAADRERAKTPERRQQITRTVKNWRQRHPERVRAHSAVARALRRGDLVKGPCEREDEGGGCNGQVHGHHDDYSKPLEVRWLCAAHHGELRRGGEAGVAEPRDRG